MLRLHFAFIQVYQWSGKDTSVDEEMSQYFDLSTLIRLANTSPEHARVARYVQSMLAFMASLAWGQRSAPKEHLQKYFPYELLILGLNSFSLGHGIRTSIARLLDVLYVDRYPHRDVFSDTLFLIDRKGEDISPKFLQKFDYRAYAEAIDPAATLKLSVDDILEYNDVDHDIKSVNAFVMRLCSGTFIIYISILNRPHFLIKSQTPTGKFKLLLSTIVSSLADERLLKLLAEDTTNWTKDHGNIKLRLYRRKPCSQLYFFFSGSSRYRSNVTSHRQKAGGRMLRFKRGRSQCFVLKIIRPCRGDVAVES